MPEQDEGDASVPTPRLIHLRPYGDEAASEGTSQKTTCVNPPSPLQGGCWAGQEPPRFCLSLFYGYARVHNKEGLSRVVSLRNTES